MYAESHLRAKHVTWAANLHIESCRLGSLYDSCNETKKEAVRHQDATWRSPIGKLLCSSVVIHSRKVSCMFSVTVRVSITSSMNARPR